MKIINLIAFIIVLIGCINWALVGIFDINLVALIFMGYRTVGSIIMYILVGVSALWLLLSSIASHGKIDFVENAG